jgi:hypothetical protein
MKARKEDLIRVNRERRGMAPRRFSLIHAAVLRVRRLAAGQV